MLAVLPFENLSGDPSQGYLSDGLTEEMITQLGKLKPERLGVIARTSSMHYKGTSETAAEIGRELKVDYLLEGGVRREGTHLRISARLIRVPDETQLWARDYDADVRDFLALQANVGADIVSGIELKLTEREQAQLAVPQLSDPRAHEDLLLGRFFWNKRTDEDTRKAINARLNSIRTTPPRITATPIT
jgi:TolB-like protein